MQPDTRDQLQTQLSAAFDEFQKALSEALTAEAQRTVDGEIAKLATGRGPFNVHDAEVEVIVRNIRIGPRDADGAQRATPRSSRRRRSSGAKRAAKPRSAAPGRRGRPDGPVRTALLQIFEQAQGRQFTIAELDGELRAAGVETTVDNLHQQLRRLAAAGTLERPGRGLYRRAGAP